MTLIEVYEGKAKDIQLKDKLYWNESFREVAAIIPGKCPCPCLGFRVAIDWPGKPPVLKDVFFSANSGVLFRRPEA